MIVHKICAKIFQSDIILYYILWGNNKLQVKYKDKILNK